MTDYDTPKPPRIIRRDGKWLVPESERPANWRELEKPIPHVEKPRDVPVSRQHRGMK